MGGFALILKTISGAVGGFQRRQAELALEKKKDALEAEARTMKFASAFKDRVDEFSAADIELFTRADAGDKKAISEIQRRNKQGFLPDPEGILTGELPSDVPFAQILNQEGKAIPQTLNREAALAQAQAPEGVQVAKVPKREGAFVPIRGRAEAEEFRAGIETKRAVTRQEALGEARLERVTAETERVRSREIEEQSQKILDQSDALVELGIAKGLNPSGPLMSNLQDSFLRSIRSGDPTEFSFYNKIVSDPNAARAELSKGIALTDLDQEDSAILESLDPDLRALVGDDAARTLIREQKLSFRDADFKRQAAQISQELNETRLETARSEKPQTTKEAQTFILKLETQRRINDKDMAILRGKMTDIVASPADEKYYQGLLDQAEERERYYKEEIRRTQDFIEQQTTGFTKIATAGDLNEYAIALADLTEVESSSKVARAVANRWITPDEGAKTLVQARIIRFNRGGQ